MEFNAELRRTARPCLPTLLNPDNADIPIPAVTRVSVGPLGRCGALVHGTEESTEFHFPI